MTSVDVTSDRMAGRGIIRASERMVGRDIRDRDVTGRDLTSGHAVTRCALGLRLRTALNWKSPSPRERLST